MEKFTSSSIESGNNYIATHSRVNLARILEEKGWGVKVKENPNYGNHFTIEYSVEDSDRVRKTMTRASKIALFYGLDLQNPNVAQKIISGILGGKTARLRI